MFSVDRRTNSVRTLLIGLISLSSLATICVRSANDDNKYTCPHGWTRYGNRKCLKYVNELLDYEKAQAVCRTKNQGNLVTIHSHDEQNFVYSYIHSIAASSTPIWLGAKQIDFESILWLDKIETSYTNWAPSEPSHPDEICIAINPRNGMWHDVMCTEANVPACERAPTTQWPFFVAFCSEGWFQFNDEKCVRIISSQALNFYESQELCRSKYNSKLLSIKTDKESEFVHNLMKFRDVKLPVWLGAIQNDFSSFNWIDKSDITFTNWADGEPNDPDHACLSMTASSGKWSDNDCKEQKLILCQNMPEDGSCETGWLQFRQDKCYRFVHIRLSFDDAESLCNNLYGGHLPSIHSQEEQFMISQFLASVNVKNGSEIWLGGRQMDFHNFNWGDGSVFNYSYWEHGEPSFPTEKCIEMSWRNGRWNDISCRLKRAVLCERQVTSRMYLKPNLYQPTTCLDLAQNCTTNAPASSSSSSPSSPSGSIVSLTTTSPASILSSASPSSHAAPDVHQTMAGSFANSSSKSSASGSNVLTTSSSVGDLATGNGTIIRIPMDLQGNADIINSNAQTNPSPGGDHSPSYGTTGNFSSEQQLNSQISPADIATTGDIAAPKVNEFIMAPEDKPIKVITSIMHREQQSPVQLLPEAMIGKSAPIENLPPNVSGVQVNHNLPAVPSSDSKVQPQQRNTQPNGQKQNNSSTTEFIHYNLPPPDQISSNIKWTTQTTPALTKNNKTALNNDSTEDQSTSMTTSSLTTNSGVSGKANTPEIYSLIDKLKPPVTPTSDQRLLPSNGTTTTSEKPKEDSNNFDQPSMTNDFNVSSFVPSSVKQETLAIV